MGITIDLVIEKFGSVDNFLNQLCEKQGIDIDTPDTEVLNKEVGLTKKEVVKCKTIDEVIRDLEYWKEVLGGDTLVSIDDSSGYPRDVVVCYEDEYGAVIIG